MARAAPGVGVVAAVVAFAGSRSSVLPLVVPAVRSVVASGRAVAVGCAAGVDAAVVAAVVAAGAASRLAVFAVADPGGLPFARVAGLQAAAAAGASVSWFWPPAVPAGRSAFAARTRLVLAASVAGGPGSGLVAFPSGPCPAVCQPVAGGPSGALFSGRVTGGGSGSWLAVALAVGAGLPVAVFLPAGVAAPAWAGGSWVPAASSGVWASALRWSPSLLVGIPAGPGALPASWSQPGSPAGDPARGPICACA